MGYYEKLLYVSVRTNDPDGDAGVFIRQVVRDLGRAGGHNTMSAARLPMTDNSDAEFGVLRAELLGRMLDRLAEKEGGRGLSRRLSSPMSSFLVIGLNAMGRALTQELSRRGAKVTVADRDDERIGRHKDLVSAALCLDTTDRNALTVLEVEQFDHVIVCMSHRFEEAERSTLALHDLGAKGVTNFATTKGRSDILYAIGAERVVTPGLLQARNLAVTLCEELIESFWFVGDEQGMAEVLVRHELELSAETIGGINRGKVRYPGVSATRRPRTRPGRGADRAAIRSRRRCEPRVDAGRFHC